VKDISLIIRKFVRNSFLPNNFPYYDNISYNTSPNSIDGASSLSVLPFKKSFFFCIDDNLARILGGKKKLYDYSLR
jgi:hypothetical protein